MKKFAQNLLLVLLGIIISVVTNVTGAVISSGAVSYSNTTVSAALDELFSAVDINNKIGTTDISDIGDGTITGAISTLNSSLYESEEIQIGMFNKKPLYRKVIKIDSVTIPNTAGLEPYTYYLNLDNPEIIWVNGVRIGPYQLPGYTAGIVTTYVATVSSSYNGAITLRNKEQWTNVSLYIDVAYTKTTD